MRRWFNANTKKPGSVPDRDWKCRNKNGRQIDAGTKNKENGTDPSKEEIWYTINDGIERDWRLVQKTLDWRMLDNGRATWRGNKKPACRQRRKFRESEFGKRKKTDDCRTDNQDMIDKCGAADWRQTRPRKKWKTRRYKMKFAAKIEGTEACNGRRTDTHRNQKTGRCLTVQVVKSSAPANGNWHWGMDDSLAAASKHEGGHTTHAMGAWLKGQNARSMRLRCKKEKSVILGDTKDAVRNQRSWICDRENYIHSERGRVYVLTVHNCSELSERAIAAAGRNRPQSRPQ